MNLKKHNIVKKIVGGCACSKEFTSYSYGLPKRLNLDIVNYIQHFGVMALPFEKHAVLMLNGDGFSITGVRKLKEIKFILKNKKAKTKIIEFEQALVNYVKKT